MRRRLELAQCADGALIADTGVEVGVWLGDEVDWYLVGEDVEDGETVILPLDDGGNPTGIKWWLDGYTVMDAVEALQTIEPCRHCDGGGSVEHVSPRGAIRDEECDECNGRGWRD